MFKNILRTFEAEILKVLKDSFSPKLGHSCNKECNILLARLSRAVLTNGDTVVAKCILVHKNVFLWSVEQVCRIFRQASI